MADTPMSNTSAVALTTRSTRAHGRAIGLFCLVLAACYYALLLSAGGSFFAPVTHGLTFNSMLLHLLHGRFDVDPATIGDEGFLRDGATYAYFGVLPALLRMPLLLLKDFATTDFTRLSCLAAVVASAAFKVSTAGLIVRRLGAQSAPILLALLVGVVLLGGPQLAFLRPSIFQETTFWAVTCAAAFIYLLVRGWLSPEGFSTRILASMALAAGICLLARVSTALGLYLACGLVWLRLFWCAAASGRLRHDPAKFVLAAAILLGFAALAALINQARWGNPFIFVDLASQIIAQTRFPDRIARLHQYGEFNPARVPYAVGYYFLPVWVLLDGSGGLLWSAFQLRLFDFVELPPGSFIVSDPLLLGLAALGLIQLMRRRVPRSDVIVAALGGLLVPVGLMLSAIALTYRYRLEFYPFIELCAFVGFGSIVAAPKATAQRWMALGAAWQVIAAHAMWLLYMLSPFGPAQIATDGLPVGAFYRSLLQ